MKIVIMEGDLSDDYLRFAQQTGVDGLDINDPMKVPNVKERGCPDLDGLLKLKKRIRAAGLDLFRLTLPSPKRYLRGEPGGEEDLQRTSNALECFGKASVPIAVVPVHWELNPGQLGGFERAHRGGYKMFAFSLERMREQIAETSGVLNKGMTIDDYLDRCVKVYERLIPIAEEHQVKIALHPSDPPVSQAPFTLLGLERIFDEVRSHSIGLLYCVGTRYESGADVIEEIRYFGKRRKIFHVHFRNVRGTIPTTGGYEEVMLGDGNMNMRVILETLKEVGYEGGINPDHVPVLASDTSTRMIAWAYALGYVKGLLATLS